LHLHDDWLLHRSGSHHALLLLVRHRLQHQRVGFLEAPTFQDPRDGEERADKGEEATHRERRDGAGFWIAAIEPRVGEAESFAPEISLFAKGAAITDVHFFVLLRRGVAPTFRRYARERGLFTVEHVVGIFKTRRVGRDCAVRRTASVDGVPVVAVDARRAHLCIWLVGFSVVKLVRRAVLRRIGRRRAIAVAVARRALAVDLAVVLDKVRARRTLPARSRAVRTRFALVRLPVPRVAVFDARAGIVKRSVGRLAGSVPLGFAPLIVVPAVLVSGVVDPVVSVPLLAVNGVFAVRARGERSTLAFTQVPRGVRAGLRVRAFSAALGVDHVQEFFPRVRLGVLLDGYDFPLDGCRGERGERRARDDGEWYRDFRFHRVALWCVFRSRTSTRAFRSEATMGRVFTINSLVEVHLPAHHQRIFVILVTLASRNSSMSEMCTRIENVPGGTFSSSRNNVQKRRKTVY